MRQITLTALVLLASLAAASPKDGVRAGWHGEPMPDGLVKADAKGEYLWQKDGAVMVYVPPGAFAMGSDGGPVPEQPVHEVHLDGYYIDKYEVSWGQWKRSGLPYSEIPESRRKYPEAPDWGIVDDHPVLNVSWNYAKKYVEWAGKRLPTEAEWEKAARGTDARTYPWGNEPPTYERAVWRENPIAAKSTAPVDCCTEGASPYGVVNMAGNVYEWCEDVYDRNFYARSPVRNPVNLDGGLYRVLRGGALFLEREDLRAALRYRLYPHDRTGYIGLRSVVPLGGGAELERDDD